MSTWGVNQALATPVITTATSNVSCPAGTETNVLQASLFSSTQGLDVYLECAAEIVITLGSTAPSALAINIHVAGSPDVDTFTVPPVLLVANANLVLSPVLVASANRLYFSPAIQFNLSVTPTGQAVTVQAQSRAVWSMVISADV
jgi:hypothetical protein